MNFMSKILKDRIQVHAYSGPLEAYSQELSRHTREKENFVRNPAAEQLILQRWDLAGFYAKNVLKDRWPEFESVIASAEPTNDLNKITAVHRYASSVVGDRFEPGEKHIANDAGTAAEYSVHVMGRPWVQEGEVSNDVSRKAHNRIIENTFSGASILYHHAHDQSQYRPTAG